MADYFDSEADESVDSNISESKRNKNLDSSDDEIENGL